MDSSVILNWVAPEYVTSVTYAVYQAEGTSAPTDPANWVLVQDNITANSFTVTGLENGKSYVFAVKAVDAAVQSDFSNAVTATPQGSDSGGSGGNSGGDVGGSGGGSDVESDILLSTDGVITIPPGKSGEVRLDDEIIIKVSSGAAGQELQITIEKLSDTSGLLTDQETLVSHIFEVLANAGNPFDKPISISLRFDPSKAGEDQKIAIFYYDEEDKR